MVLYLIAFADYVGNNWTPRTVHYILDEGVVDLDKCSYQEDQSMILSIFGGR